MKILFAIKAMNDARGGAERVLADVTAGLADLGHEIVLLSYDPPGGESFYPLARSVRRLCLGIGKTDQSTNLPEIWARMKALRRTVNEEKPDIVVAFMHSMFVPMALALIGTGVPVIASEHIVPAHYKTRKKEFFLLLASSFFVKKITVLSESVRAQYPRFLYKRMVVMTNPVTFPPPDQYADPAGKSAERKVILNVGRMDPQKDQATLIRSFALLAKDYPDWDVKILGEGALRRDLEKLVSDLGLGGRVFLPGTTQDISNEYKNAHIFALPSFYESFGLATAEAMAHGLPVLGFATCAGTNELIHDNENGFLVRGADRIKSFSEALERLMSSPELRVQFGQRAQKGLQRFHPEIIAKQWQALLKRIQMLNSLTQNYDDES